ncbi:DUF6023 family protein [Paractinoplanes rhizophilus]|jgi:hypothetical protein|uniref:DUF6023 family protein n=1 Tax=Paractinoplanes rhizophilus TaxID=1416877 RepID=A0ABW2HKU0_9ACTN|nr:DUF6023 family protein [Actinoplanes sp.]
MGDRARGAVLYGCAAVLLAGGATWWVWAAPRDAAVDPTIERWRQTAMRLLPDQPEQDDADMLALAPETDHQVLAKVDGGNYRVSVVCVGGARSQVRVSLGEAGTDSGHGLDCADGAVRDRFDVATSGRLRMFVSVNDAGPVVFRYTLLRRGD